MSTANNYYGVGVGGAGGADGADDGRRGGGGDFSGQCNFCGKFGHKAAACWSLKRDRQKKKLEKKQAAAAAKEEDEDEEMEAAPPQQQQQLLADLASRFHAPPRPAAGKKELKEEKEEGHRPQPPRRDVAGCLGGLRFLFFVFRQGISMVKG
ncbi:uncharacterized protein B0J16DRAFT_317947 [Fusarium flagelliforme]|nr:uncharacterized protein B0J16DRAFT_317947 [Fusarium flagelliforme]KAH7188279.1 hypothetical protein B0J16DRAFT_317947 [Fusarium flagelliforme]